MTRTEVVVVGAGLAGLACAFELSRRGREVLLLETRPVVGGRTSSWDADGMYVESGLHRMLGFYEAFPSLLRQAGIEIDDITYWEDEVEIRLPEGGPRGVFGTAPLFRPLQTIGGPFANLDLLSPVDLFTLVTFIAAGLAEYFANPAALDRVTVREKAEALGVTRNAIERALVPLTAGLYFLPPERYSAFAFFSVLGPYLPRLPLIRVGAFLGGMTEVMTGPLAAAVERQGGEVRTRARVTRLLVERGEVAGVEVGGQRILAEHVVLATSLLPAQQLVGQAFPRHPWFAPMLRLPSMPSVTLHVELDTPSMAIDRVTFAPGTVLASFAEESRTTFRGSAGRLSVILTPPEPFLQMSDGEVLALAIRDAARLGIHLQGHVLDYRVVRLPADFYALEPGSEALRPPQETPIPGLTLAGDYTKQPYIATMEGAVVSGQRAARVVERGRQCKPAPRPGVPS